jgi:hypothetical protein
MKRDSGSFARRLAFAVCPVLAIFLSISHALASQYPPSESDSDDVILINGKIITVDGRKIPSRKRWQSRRKNRRRRQQR